MRFKEWVYNKNIKEGVDLISQLLSSRGITEPDAVKEFLNPLEMDITSPYEFTDMEKAASRIVSAIENNEKIVIYGDFDADGMTSTAVLFKTLIYLGADADYYIPQRDKEGHGLVKSALVGLITKHKPKVVITVDCGISNFEEVAFLKSFKIDTIITDHHEAKDELPKSFAIINPKAQNALSDNLSIRKITELTYLAGVGVAFKLSQALLEKCGKTDFVKELLPLVAVGTIADLVPLLGENRNFVKRGLELITRHKGLKALLEGAGYDISKEITSETVAFGIAPRLNASGRLDTVESAMKLLLSDNTVEINFAVQTLNELNAARQALCSKVFAQADEMWHKEGMKSPAVILCNPEWHIGIVGIVASGFVEKYNKPAFLMNYSEEEKKYRCSARGIKGLNIFDIMNENSRYFETFGGHELAGGFTFSGEKYSFEEVKNAINSTINEMLDGKELKPVIEVDLKLKPEDITSDLINRLKILEPCGASNPSPVFALENLTVCEKKLMGDDKSHLKLFCDAPGAQKLTCLWWKAGNLPLQQGSNIDVLFHPEINEYNGNTYVQLIVHDLHSDDIKYDTEDENINKLNIFDHRNKTDILPMVNEYVKNTKYTIGVFAESKSVTDTLKPYKALTSRIINRDTLKNVDVIMFFDYPADKFLFSQILEQTGAKILHFMNFQEKKFTDEEIVSTALKMIKYAISNNDGVIEYYKFTSFLGLSMEALQILFSILARTGFIKIISEKDNSIKVKSGDVTDIALVYQADEYADLKEAIQSSREFQHFLRKENLENLDMIANIN